MIQLFEETEKITWIGGEGYAFGAWTAAGALAAVLCVCLYIRRKKLLPGSGLLASLAALVLGIVCSRAFFCLTTQELGHMLPLGGWLRADEGGWSTTGLVCGALLGAWLAAGISRQSAGSLLDAVCLGLPLFMVMERLGEKTTIDFDISRVISEETEGGGWLTVQDIYGTYLAVFRIAAIVAVVLFVVLLVLSLRRTLQPGDLCVVFLILFGACSIITESLRYDEFLAYHFVKFQQVGAALMLLAGLWAAARRSPDADRRIRTASFVTLVLLVGIVIGLEFVLDRTEFSKPLVYAAMILCTAVPAALGLAQIRAQRRKTRKIRK